ncbi:hypothetical protein [Methylocapsa acidiphila]|uniref:hypothetical protein n=1 Tax=Methylocapsa acidiphila TaxID=133552 RepID=UPI0004063982|nr:hypothetical protein [Methylocapsa acidiphila]
MKHHEPYLPAEALGVEDWEREELIALCSKLMAEAAALDMNQAASDCGSVGCIGGHIALAHGISVLGARRYVQGQAQAGGSLAALFFPDLTVDRRHPGWRANGAAAARAILNFLTTGRPNWDGVMSGGL